MAIPNPRLQSNSQQRRSQRILLCVPIVVSGEHSNGAAFSERTKTQVVNAHGGLIHLKEPVGVGQEIRIKNLATNEEIRCTVVDVSVANTDIPEVGVSFFQLSASFWRVSFPPEDWSPRSPEAKRVSFVTTQKAPVIAKK